MENMKVSVIVLTYNHEKYIKQALDGILMQKVDFDYEILVGDDGSKDRTVDILKEYKNKFPEKIKLILNKKNIGATKNAYNILMKANGKYLATCEGDDYWTDENKLQIQVDFLENNPQYVGCTHKFTIVDEYGEKLKNQYLSWIKPKKIFTLNDFQGIYMPGQPSTFVRKNIKNNVDLEYLYKVHDMIGDRILMLLYLMEGNFFSLDQYMSCYRKQSNSITKKLYQNNIDAIKNDYEITLNLEKICKLHNIILDTTEFRKILFVKSIIFYFYTFNKNYLYVVVEMLKINYRNILYVLDVPFYIIKYLWRLL